MKIMSNNNDDDKYVFKFHDDFWWPIINDIKTSTIRDSSKPVNIHETVTALFKPSGNKKEIKITKHYAVRFKDIDNEIAEKEGYLHDDLLKHELRNIYPNLKDDDYVYVYEFKKLF